jgi:hypothetical protein
MTLTTDFAASVRRTFTAYTVDLAAADHKGVQYIVLVDGDGRSFELGWVDAFTKKAELRTLGRTLSLSKQLLGKELRLPPMEYMRYIDAATKLLEANGFDVTVVAWTRSVPPPRDAIAERVRTATLPYYAFAVSTVGALGGVLYLVGSR